MIVIEDQAARLDAIDPERSFICEAPAGSGKTELLTQRVLQLLSRVDKPEEVLAITFTNKAAAEMRERIVSALLFAAESEEPELPHKKQTWQLARKVLQRDASLQWQLLDAPSRLQIKTFDSLCASLANALPMFSSFASPPVVADDSDELYRHAVDCFLSEMDESNPWTPSIVRVLHLLDNNLIRLRDLLVDMLAQRNMWLPLIGKGSGQAAMFDSLETNLARVRQDIFARVNVALSESLRKSLSPMLGFAASNLADDPNSIFSHCINIELDHPKIPELSETTLDIWQALCALLLTANNQWRNRLTKKEGFPTGSNAQEKKAFKQTKEQMSAIIERCRDNEELLLSLKEFRQLPAAHYDVEQSDLLVSLVELLPILVAYLSLSFKEQGKVDFSEVSLRASSALGDIDQVSDLALALDYKIQHVLVDEFQDTSPSQIELLEKLIAGWQVGDGRTFFCVGDAMQSIYSFRGANVGIFLSCMKHGIGSIPLTPLKLTTNFRSSEPIVEWNNEVFSQIFPVANDIATGAVRFSSSTAVDKQKDDNNCQVYVCDSEALETKTVVDLVLKARNISEDQTIAVLVRDRNTAARLKPELEKANLPFQALELESLAEKPIVIDLLALTLHLLWPSDDIAAYSVFRAPWCGLELDSLLQIQSAQTVNAHSIYDKANTLLIHNKESTSEKSTNDIPQGDLFAASDKSHEVLHKDQTRRLAFTLKVLQEAQMQRGRLSLQDWVEGTWIALGGPACVDDLALENAQLYFDMLAKLDLAKSYPNRDTLTRQLKRLYSKPSHTSDPKLQIMTIHKSKGLEFDTVILPGLHKVPPPPSEKLLRWFDRLSDDGEQQFLLSAITAAGKEKDSIYQYIQSLEVTSEEHERIRLLYVACTRAKTQLYLVTQCKTKAVNDGQAELEPPSKRSLIGKLWPAVREKVIVLASQQETISRVDEQTSVAKMGAPSLTRLAKDFKYPNLQEGTLLADFIPFYEHQNNSPAIESPLKTQGDSLASRTGTVIHKILQTINDQSLKDLCHENNEEQRRHWRTLLIREGVPRPRLEEAMSKIQRCMSSIANDPKAAWIFSDEYVVSEREFSISLASRAGKAGQLGEVVHERRVIDRIIQDSGSTWIIDYKTSEHGPSEPLEEFIDAELKEYQSAMRHYQYCLQTLGYSNVRMALYFPMLPHWVEVK